MTRRESVPFPPLNEVWKQPCGKTPYESRAEATKDAQRISRRNRQQHRTVGAVAYKCPECRVWHLTSKLTDRTP